MNDDNARTLAIEILDLFEDLLNQHDITIPSPDRCGNQEEARLYGDIYYALEDQITELIKKKQES